MSDLSAPFVDLPEEQKAIRAKCFHPSGSFVEFGKEEVEQSIPERFEKIVHMYPGRLAVRTRNCSFTYDELNGAANRLAHAILAERETRQEPIVLLLDRDGKTIVGILGVLKAGQICAPLDPSYSPARIEYVMRNTRANLIVTNNKNLPLANQALVGDCQSINIDELDPSPTRPDPSWSKLLWLRARQWKKRWQGSGVSF